MKNDIGELDTDLQQEKEKNMSLNKQLHKLKAELATAKRTITNYRKMVAENQKDFFKPSKVSVPSTNSGTTAFKYATKDNSSIGEKEDDASSNSVIQRGIARDRSHTLEENSMHEADSVNHKPVSP